MTDSENATGLPIAAKASRNHNTADALIGDIQQAVWGARDGLDDVKCGLRAFLGFAADNDSAFARDAHYVIRKVDDDLDRALKALDAVADASRLKARERNKVQADDTAAAVERLKAAVAGVGPENLDSSAQRQKMVDDAIGDALFLLFSSTYSNHWAAIQDALSRLGYRLERRGEV